jgi:glycine dehydrogenase subunit 2
LELGFHPPTVYFPLIVKEALMVEPTETESKETLEAFAEAMGELLSQAQGVAGKRPLHHPSPPPGRAQGQQDPEAHLL